MARTAPAVSTSRALRTARPVRLAVVGAALSMAFALTSCSDSGGNNNNGDDDAASPTASSATATNTEFVPASTDGPAQNVPVPELPDAAREQTEEGAEATLKYWWDALEYLYLTGDSSVLKDVSGDECLMCDNFLEVVPETYANDGWYTLEEPFTISQVVIRDAEQDQMALFEYEVVQPKSQYFDSEGSLDSDRSIERSLEKIHTLVSYSAENNHWLVNELAPGNYGESSDDE